MKFTHRDQRRFVDHDRNEDLDESILDRLPELTAEIGRITALIETSAEPSR